MPVANILVTVSVQLIINPRSLKGTLLIILKTNWASHLKAIVRKCFNFKKALFYQFGNKVDIGVAATSALDKSKVPLGDKINCRKNASSL